MKATENNVKVGSILVHRDIGQSRDDFWYPGRKIEVTEVTSDKIHYVPLSDNNDLTRTQFYICGLVDFDILMKSDNQSKIVRLREIKKKIEKLMSKIDDLQAEECQLKIELEIN